MNNAVARSNFVTVLAWISIVFTGFGFLMSVLQNVMVHTVFVGPEFDQALQDESAANVPALAAFMMGHFKLIFGSILVVSAVALATSIGLLLRKNWARIAYIGLMALGIAWSVAGLVIQFWLFSSTMSVFQQVPPDAPDMKPFLIATAVISVIFAAGFVWLYGWIIKRLLSASIVAEFKPTLS